MKSGEVLTRNSSLADSTAARLPSIGSANDLCPSEPSLSTTGIRLRPDVRARFDRYRRAWGDECPHRGLAINYRFDMMAAQFS
jgi:hypothetical protein